MINERIAGWTFALKMLLSESSDIKRCLDVGPGLGCFPRVLCDMGYDVKAVDEGDLYWGKPIENKYFDVSIKDVIMENGKYDFITCLGVLSHTDNACSVVNHIYRILRNGGMAVFGYIHNDTQSVTDVYKLEGATDPKARYIARCFSSAEVDGWMYGKRWLMVSRENYKMYDGEYWACGSRYIKPVSVRRGKSQYEIIAVRKDDNA